MLKASMGADVNLTVKSIGEPMEIFFLSLGVIDWKKKKIIMTRLKSESLSTT